MPWQKKDEQRYDRDGTHLADRELMDPKASYYLEKQLGIRDSAGQVMLKSLKPKHHKMIQMHLAGVPSTEIAKTLGIARNTVFNWMRDPLIIEEIRKGKQAWEDEFDALYGKAIQAVRAGLDDMDPTHSLRAAAIYFRQKQDAAQLKVGGGKETAEDIIARMLQINIQINQQETK